MKTKMFFYNSISSAVLQIITIVGGFILPRLYLITYGSEINGLVTSINQFVTYFGFIEAGLGTALIYSLYKPLALGDENEINGIVSLAKKSYIKASGIYLLLVVFLSFIYPYIVQSENTDKITISLLVFVMGTFGAMEFFFMAKYRVLLVADQREFVISFVLIIAYLVNFTAAISLILLKANIVFVRTVPLISFFIRAALLHRYVNRKYKYINYDQPADVKHLERRWDALIMQVGVSVNISVPIVILSMLTSLKMASVFNIYEMVFAGLISIISIFTSGISASFGNFVANKEFRNLETVHNLFEFSIYGLTSFLYSCALLLIGSFISIYTKGVTDIQYSNYLYGVLFVIWGILFNSRIPYTSLINAAGLYKEARKVNISQVLLLITLSVVLVQFYQMSGLLVAMSISCMFWVGGLIFIVKKSMIKIFPFRTFLRVIRMFAIVFVSYIPVIIGIEITADTFSEWFISTIKVMIWCGFVSLTINYIFDKKPFQEVCCRIRDYISISIKQRG